MGNNFVKGAAFGAAAALFLNYLLNTDEGKETCQKVKDKVKNAVDDLASTIENGFEDFNKKEQQPESSQAIVPTEQNTDGAE